MPEKDYIVELSKCVTVQDIDRLFMDAKFPNKGNSGFFDESLSFISSGHVLGNAKVGVGGFSGLLVRVMSYLKFSGYIGNTPMNVGEINYFSDLNSFFKDINQIKNIYTIEDIDSELINKYIIYQRSKNNKTTTIHNKIMKVFEVLDYSEDIGLPYVLRFDYETLSNSVEFEKIAEGHKRELNQKLAIKEAKEPYPLSDLKLIVSKSIEYLEGNREDILLISKMYVDTKKIEDQGEKNTVRFDYFRNNKHKFIEPNLKKLQTGILAGKYIDITDSGYLKAGKTNKIILKSINKMETACVSIILMMTGMRVGELCTLDRNLKITQDEHLHLERIVYKTASDEDGEPLSMPIPQICKYALETLVEISSIKDNGEYNNMLLTSIESKPKPVRTSRVNQLLNRYCSDLGLEKPIEPHQFRHSMAFLIVHIHNNEGLELARMFLGHTSIVMTLQYMGNFNNEIKSAIAELQKDESEQLVVAITEQIHNNKRLFGKNGERLMPNAEFTGKQADDFVKLMRKGLLQLIDEQKLAIIQTPVSLCMHDLSKPEELACQRGFDIVNIATSGPAPSRCKGANCSNALFFEEHLVKLQDDMYADVDPELKARLEQNTYFMEAGGFEQDPFKKLVNEYKQYKEGVA